MSPPPSDRRRASRRGPPRRTGLYAVALLSPLAATLAAGAGIRALRGGAPEIATPGVAAPVGTPVPVALVPVALVPMAPVQVASIPAPPVAEPAAMPNAPPPVPVVSVPSPPAAPGPIDARPPPPASQPELIANASGPEPASPPFADLAPPANIVAPPPRAAPTVNRRTPAPTPPVPTAIESSEPAPTQPSTPDPGRFRTASLEPSAEPETFPVAAARAEPSRLDTPPDLTPTIIGGTAGDPPRGRVLDTDADELVPPRRPGLQLAQADPTFPPSPTDSILPTPGTASARAAEAGPPASGVALQPDVGLRTRDGRPGLDRLRQYLIPLEATFPAGGGAVTFQVTPTRLETDRVRPADRTRFGALALGGAAAIPGGDESAEGVGLALRFRLPRLALDVGSTPLGLRQVRPVGGVVWSPQLTAGLSLRLTGERRAVTDSLISYAGAIDPVTGTTWGGVTRTRGLVELVWSADGLDVSAGAGGGSADGTHVRSNREIEAVASASYALLDDLRLGLAVHYLDDAHNERGSRLGQGGYFSPQNYVSVLAPVAWHGAAGAFAYDLGGSVGWQRYRENAQPFFPRDPALKPGGSTAGADRSGLAGDAHAVVDLRLGDRLHVGGRLGYRRLGPYDDAEAALFGRYVFGGL